MNRRHFLKIFIIGIICAPFVFLFKRKDVKPHLWQIDPSKCIQCGKCEKLCVLTQSAVRCVHQYASCGYCEFCSGYFQDKRTALNSAAENQRCPTRALKRNYIEDAYFEYTVDEALCIGCGRCVKGCSDFGNGSLFLQVRHHLCKNCNQCLIATHCPSQAFTRVSVDKPYIFKTSLETPK